MTCGEMVCGNEDKFYSLVPEATSDCPKSIEELERWLSDQGNGFNGKLYVAVTIHWNSNKHRFEQEGCGPCYLEKQWSLACCKHDMRSNQEFRSQVENSRKRNGAYFIFTLASKKGSGLPPGGQALVSVAKVTQTFDSMKLYAEFLCRQSQAIKFSRLTRLSPNDKYKGWQFGDCHANCKGELGRPNSKQHGHWEEEWLKDNNRESLILYSDHFLIWEEPKIISCETIRQDRWGRDISPDKLGQRLKSL